MSVCLCGIPRTWKLSFVWVGGGGRDYFVWIIFNLPHPHNRWWLKLNTLVNTKTFRTYTFRGQLYLAMFNNWLLSLHEPEFTSVKVNIVFSQISSKSVPVSVAPLSSLPISGNEGSRISMSAGDPNNSTFHVRLLYIQFQIVAKIQYFQALGRSTSLNMRISLPHSVNTSSQVLKLVGRKSSNTISLHRILGTKLFYNYYYYHCVQMIKKSKILNKTLHILREGFI